MACRRRGQWRHRDRGSSRGSGRGLRQDVPCVSARSRRQQALRLLPDPGRPVSLEIVSENRSHGGRQLVVKHPSVATGTDMSFSIFLPPKAGGGRKLPVVWYLSGLTC